MYQRDSAATEPVNVTYRKGNTRSTGARYEEQAVQFLKEKGYIMLERNFRCPFAEIDIVALHQDVLVFCEVKYRYNTWAGSALEAVDVRKQRRISAAALFYIRRSGRRQACRFDVIGIQDQKITLIQDAFPFRF